MRSVRGFRFNRKGEAGRRALRSKWSARRALPVLKTPQALERFDVSRVTGAMVRKVKETLKLEALQARCLPPHPSPPLAPR